MPDLLRMRFGRDVWPSMVGCLLPFIACAVESGPAGPTLQQELAYLKAERVTVTTASLREEEISHAPGTVRVVTRSQIRDRGYRSLYELMRDLPGVDVLDHAQAESKNRIAIRGVTGNNKFLILQDGIRIDSPTGERITPVLENFPLYYVKQVEVLYGPDSAIYGADAFTGVINLISRDPAEDGTFDFVVEGGEFGTGRTEFYGSQRLDSSLALSFGGHWHTTDGAPLDEAYPELYQLDDLRLFDGTVAIPAEQRNGYEAPYDSWSTWAKADVGRNLTLGWNQSLFSSSYFESGSPVGADFGQDGGETLLMTGYAKVRHQLSENVNGQVQVNYSRYEQLPDGRFKNRLARTEACPLNFSN